VHHVCMATKSACAYIDKFALTRSDTLIYTHTGAGGEGERDLRHTHYVNMSICIDVESVYERHIYVHICMICDTHISYICLYA